MVRPANTADIVHVEGGDHVYRYIVVSGFAFTQCREASRSVLRCEDFRHYQL